MGDDRPAKAESVRIGPAVLTACLASLPFAVTIANASDSGSWRFWGSLLGAFAILTTFGVTLWAVNRKSGRGQTIGRAVLALVLAMIGAFLTWLALVSGVPPLSSGGLAVYPLTLALIVAAAFLVNSIRSPIR